MRGCQECLSINLDAQWTALLEMASIVRQPQAWIGNGCRREASQTSIWPTYFSKPLKWINIIMFLMLILKIIHAMNDNHNSGPLKAPKSESPQFSFSRLLNELPDWWAFRIWRPWLLPTSLKLISTLQIQKLDPQKGLLCLLCWPFLSHTFLITSPSGAEFILLFRGNFSEPASTALLIETFSIESVKSKSWVKNLLGLNLCYITF